MLFTEAQRSYHERQQNEVGAGIQSSLFSLTKLPYFDCTRFHIVDPMHNLLLGTSKHVMNVWVANEILTQADFDKIQKVVGSFSVPNDIELISYRIGSGFSGFKADQWRPWTTVFSLVSLKGVLPPEHYSCWCLYVHACQILCNRTLSVCFLQKADDLLTGWILCIIYNTLWMGKSNPKYAYASSSWGIYNGLFMLSGCLVTNGIMEFLGPYQQTIELLKSN